jgi:hypothetical protein
MKVYVARSGGHKITKKMVHGHDDQVEENDLRAQGKGIIIGFFFCRSKMSKEAIDRV